jgi:hypothetical protein
VYAMLFGDACLWIRRRFPEERMASRPANPGNKNRKIFTINHFKQFDATASSRDANNEVRTMNKFVNRWGKRNKEKWLAPSLKFAFTHSGNEFVERTIGNWEELDTIWDSESYICVQQWTEKKTLNLLTFPRKQRKRRAAFGQCIP